jgi:hypothetical protein
MISIILPKACEQTIDTGLNGIPRHVILNCALQLAEKNTQTSTDAYVVARVVQSQVVLFVLSKENWARILVEVEDIPGNTTVIMYTSPDCTEANVVFSSNEENGLTLFLDTLKTLVAYNHGIKRGQEDECDAAKRQRLL